MKTHIAILSTLVGLTGIGLASTAWAVPAWSITEVKYDGPGCPQGTASATVVDGGEAFVVSFSAFSAQAGPDIPLTEASKHCNLMINVDKPDGWQFTVADIAWRGNAILDDLVNGRFRARYNFPGSPSASDSTLLEGPFLDDFEVFNRFSHSAPWSRCDGGVTTLLATGTAQVDNRLNRHGSGIITAELADGTLKMECDLNWRECGCEHCD